MYAGFISTKRSVKKIGVHQKFDTSAYKMVESYLSPGTFPSLKQILHFEGINGPDGIKTKMGIKIVGEDPSHMYDPVNNIGELPGLIKSHYTNLVSSLKHGDMVRAAFEAGWLAHYVADGLTPAHHFPYDERKDELFGVESQFGFLRKHWQWFGAKGVLSTHVNFEMGVATSLLLSKLRVQLNDDVLAHARSLGPIKFFREQANKIAKLDLYDHFYAKGWNAELGSAVREIIAPKATEVIGVIWLLAYLEAGYESATELVTVPV